MARPEAPEATDSVEIDERPPPGRVYPVLLATALGVVVLDQITKSLALDNLRDGSVDVIEGAVTLDLSFNSGGVFGLMRGFPGLFLFATIAVALAILVWVRQLEDTRWLVPLGMILGGGLGNLSDRLFRDFDGKVVDFIDLHVWPVFNLADSAIVIGVLLVLLFGARAGTKTS